MRQLAEERTSHHVQGCLFQKRSQGRQVGSILSFNLGERHSCLVAQLLGHLVRLLAFDELTNIHELCSYLQ